VPAASFVKLISDWLGMLLSKQKKIGLWCQELKLMSLYLCYSLVIFSGR